MPVQLAERVKRVKPSPTVALTGRVARLKAEGHDIIGLGIGEPDFDTPTHIADAGVDAIRNGFTRYTAVEGIPELKDAIIAKFKRDNGIAYTRPQILASTGAKQTIYNLFMAVVDPGDEVVIPAPYWVSYPDMALLADGVPVMPYAGPEQGYKITAAQLEAAITPKTRVFMLNSPSNPTGAAYTRAELEAIAAVLRKHPRVIIATDDMYEHIYWAPEPFCSFLTACPDLYDRTVTINGVSKSYAMTGWRIGYCGGPVEIVTAMSTIQSQCTSNPVVDLAESGRRGAERRPGLCRRDEQALQGAARLLQCRPQCPARLQGPAGRGHVLRLVRRQRSHPHARPGRRQCVRRIPAGKGRGGRRTGLGLRRTGAHPLLVRGEHADAGTGPGPHGQGARRSVREQVFLD